MSENKTFHVLIADNLSPQAREILESRGVTTQTALKLNEEQLCEAVKEADAVLVRSGATITEKVLKAGKRLKVVGRAGIGVDNIDVKAASQSGIVVMNTPFSNAITTAEHSLSLLMAMARHIPAADQTTRSGRWEKSKFMGTELYCKKLGLIGCGTIGSLVAERALGLKMKVLVYDPYLSPEKAASMGVERVTLKQLLEQADFISIHAPLTGQTRYLLDEEAFSMMKDGVRLVHCARGGIVKESALLQALKSGKVAAAALDVYEEEPSLNNPLFALENVICTPHLGASTKEAQNKVAVEIAEQVAAFLLQGEVRNALNRFSLSAAHLTKLSPYLHLVECLGSFMGQSVRTSLSEIQIEYHGRAAELETKALTETALAAVLAPQNEQVNLVNARDVAKAKDISVSEVFDTNAKPYHELIKLNVKTERTWRSISGTLFADRTPRCVSIDHVALEAAFVDDMLFIRHKDQPGLIGNLGHTLSEGQVNIATLSLGRHEVGGDAIALLGLDHPVCDELLPKVRELKNIEMAQCLSFKPRQF